MTIDDVHCRHPVRFYFGHSSLKFERSVTEIKSRTRYLNSKQLGLETRTRTHEMDRAKIELSPGPLFMKQKKRKLTTERMIERMNKRTKEGTKEGTNERRNEGTNE